jgi:large subunit ribosomal protein L1
VTDDVAQAVKESQGGRVEFRMDRHANIHLPVGKLSFELEKLAENVRVAVAAVQAERPAAAKGIFIKHLSLSSTMGVGLTIAMPE